MRLLLLLLSGILTIPSLVLADEKYDDVVWIDKGHEGQGHLIMDAGEYRKVLLAPEEPLQFKDMDEFHAYLLDELYARPIVENNEIIGYEGVIDVHGSVYYPDAKTETLLPVEDPFMWLLTGKHGYFYIGEEEICLTEDCLNEGVGLMASMSKGSNRDSDTTCDSSEENCMVGTTVSKWNDFFGYRSLSIRTAQTKGGYEETSEFCWKWGFIPWSCTVVRGSNTLDFAASIHMTGGIPTLDVGEQESNLRSLERTYWVWGGGGGGGGFGSLWKLQFAWLAESAHRANPGGRVDTLVDWKK